MLLPRTRKAPRRIAVKTLRQYDAWLHPNTVFSSGLDVSAFDTAHSRVPTADDAVTTDLAASFTINEGDHLLICHAGIPNNSGHKLADSLRNTTALPDGANTLHLSAHGAKLGAGLTNTLLDEASSSFESRAKFAYFDRENFEVLSAVSTPDYTEPYGPAEFAGIVTTAGIGTDAGIGAIEISALVNYNWLEEGPIHIIRWTAGNAPSRTVIETAMEWMWYEWHRDNFVLYPPLRNYQ